tara:strand:+ start:1138 stop:1380 length:243 start_codon:yes stop_codon:yes gene_type:complete
MANNNSQKKRNRQNNKKNFRNKSIKSDLKSAIDFAEKSTKDDSEKDAAIQVAIKKLDKAYSKGIIKKNYRDRKKSNLTTK